ncbi:uncharacterized protein N7484_009290 [Penicillium longicatenatum]|uniref:uncharacterized protein n=1 Tax=Penicillium longicatenatum TaxID=1561947 RepID=UPI0025486947|nr:uncharacterized protein N7484_009290 [Penicillium longicatenatum]KAJ5635977.1 hypothetical protein N7484_009290 [Penicillium longicatenatum]
MSQQDSSEDPGQSWQSHFHPPSPQETSTRLPLPPVRRPRDGFDFRRPVSTLSPGNPGNSGNPIDLTSEPGSPPQPFSLRSPDPRTHHPARPPRFGRSILAPPEVIDLDDESDAPAQPPPRPRYTAFGDRIPDGLDISVLHPDERPWGIWPRFGGSWDHIINRHRQSAQNASIPSSNLPGTNRFNMIPHPPLRQRPRGPRPDLEPIYLGVRPVETVVLDAGPDDLILDYGSASFDMQQNTEQAETRRRESYRAPSPPPVGFTRTLGDDDVAICPNCSGELGVGDGHKEQVWVAKPCGHVRYFITLINIRLG